MFWFVVFVLEGGKQYVWYSKLGSITRQCRGSVRMSLGESGSAPSNCCKTEDPVVHCMHATHPRVALSRMLHTREWHCPDAECGTPMRNEQDPRGRPTSAGIRTRR